MKKKGLTPLFILIEFVAGMFMFILLMTIAHQWASGEDTARAFLARDTALLTDSLYASPGKTIVKYPEDTRGFSINFMQNNVEVADKRDQPQPPDLLKSNYHFVEDTGVKFDYTEVSYPPLFTKTLQKMTIGYGTFAFGEKQICLAINTRDDPKEKTVLLDAGSDNKAKLTHLITKTFGWQYSQDFKEVRLSREFPTDEPTANQRKEMADASDMAISIHFGKDEASKNEFVLYINPDSLKYLESKKLACLLRNEFLEEFSFTNSYIVKLTEIKDEKTILETDSVAVYLEIGNVDNEEFTKLLEDERSIQQNIAETIYEGVSEYYVGQE